MLGPVRPTVRDLDTISCVDSAAWDELDHRDSPFLEHGFLAALEDSHSVGTAAGWEPHVLVAEVPTEPGRRTRLVGAVVAFVKTHSFGEYIFDWSWADASERLGVPYYPKLVVASPATPASGPRLLLARDLTPAERTAVVDALVDAVREVADRCGCHSIHWLFCTHDEQRWLADRGFWPRASFQFHWHNSDYDDFDGFLTALTSRKRKQIRKERQRATAPLDGVQLVRGTQLTDDDLRSMESFYRRTTAAYGGYRYLRPGFFEALRRRAPARMLFAKAMAQRQVCAGALFFETERALYGRYWGCHQEHEFLHFELAYYVGIEHAIKRQLPRFEAGAQGEHKLLRGFLPTATYSAHWVRHPALGRAVQQFLLHESAVISEQMDRLREAGPFRCKA
ncbi:MAG: GNAT family N-acetyltransferase [Myxococcales bacterium FL481]|nr:MAG: GNAT family N-acetyltransferase [Myxococcales bacterium FL481]